MRVHRASELIAFIIIGSRVMEEKDGGQGSRVCGVDPSGEGMSSYLGVRPLVPRSYKFMCVCVCLCVYVCGIEERLDILYI